MKKSIVCLIPLMLLASCSKSNIAYESLSLYSTKEVEKASVNISDVMPKNAQSSFRKSNYVLDQMTAIYHGDKAYYYRSNNDTEKTFTVIEPFSETVLDEKATLNQDIYLKSSGPICYKNECKAVFTWSKFNDSKYTLHVIYGSTLINIESISKPNDVKITTKNLAALEVFKITDNLLTNRYFKIENDSLKEIKENEYLFPVGEKTASNISLIPLSNQGIDSDGYIDENTGALYNHKKQFIARIPESLTVSNNQSYFCIKDKVYFYGVEEDDDNHYRSKLIYVNVNTGEIKQNLNLDFIIDKTVSKTKRKVFGNNICEVSDGLYFSYRKLDEKGNAEPNEYLGFADDELSTPKDKTLAGDFMDYQYLKAGKTLLGIKKNTLYTIKDNQFESIELTDSIVSIQSDGIIFKDADDYYSFLKFEDFNKDIKSEKYAYISPVSINGSLAKIDRDYNYQGRKLTKESIRCLENYGFTFSGKEVILPNKKETLSFSQDISSIEKNCEKSSIEGKKATTEAIFRVKMKNRDIMEEFHYTLTVEL